MKLRFLPNRIAIVKSVVATLALLLATAALASDLDVVFRGQEYKDALDDLRPGTGLLPARLALVIGINQYQTNLLKLGTLTQPAADADAVASALERAGFEVTKLASPTHMVSRNEILNAIEQFNDKIPWPSARPPIIAFYFSGHGVSSLGNDGSRHQYLIPSDFRPLVAADVDEMALPIDSVLGRLGTKIPGLRIVIIDACRSDVSGMLSNGPNAPATRFEAWQKFTPSDPAPKDNATGGLALVYATSLGKTAADDHTLAQAFSDVVQDQRAKAQTARSGRNVSLSWLVNAIQSAVQGPTGNEQRAEYFKEVPSEFFIFSTQIDRNIEVYNWESARRLRAMETANAKIRFLCVIRAMKLYFGEYSYLSPLVDANDRNAGNVDCKDTSLSTTLDQNDKLTDAASISVRRLSNSTAPDLGQVTNDAPPSLDRHSSADKIAYGAYQASVFSEPSPQSKLSGQIKEGDLVQLRDGSNGDYIAILTADGVPGYVERKALLPGRAAIDLTLQFRESQFSVAPDDLHLDGLLSQVVVTDAGVTYPFSDDLLGLTRAQVVAELITSLANGGGTSSKLAPRVVSVDTDSPKQEQLAHGQIRLTLSVAPLSKDARQALGTPLLTNQLAFSDSIDLTVLAERLPSAHLPTQNTIASTTDNDKGPTIVARAGSGLSDADRCAARAMDLPRATVANRVFIQISKPEQQKDYDTVAAGLRMAGFIVPAIDLQAPVQHDQVRFCPGGGRADAAQRVATVLQQCGYATFSTVPIVDYPPCSKVKDDQVEVWFSNH